jgi:putative PIN family toxin of toxin-antitoxin system
MIQQIVIDTNIIYSALRSRRGASYRLLSLLDSPKFETNLSVPLVIEYEDVLLRKIQTLNINESEIGQFLDYLCLVGNWHEVYFLWRPILKDPKDDMILELAVRANCNYIITYNKADFQGVDTFDIKLATAKEFLQIIRELP